MVCFSLNGGWHTVIWPINNAIGTIKNYYCDRIAGWFRRLILIRARLLAEVIDVRL